MTPADQTLSYRGRQAVGNPMRADLELFQDATENEYHATHNPTGAVPLCIAENVLNWTEMEALLHRAAAEEIPAEVSRYASVLGLEEFRRAAAQFVGEDIARQELDPACLAVAAGATAIVELTALLLGDPGDAAVFPAPCYPVYRQDIANKAGLTRYDLVTHQSVGHLTGTHPLTLADLDRAHAELGPRFRLLVLTQPDNPTGAVYTAEQLTAFADWCVSHRIHLVVNEIYALSVLATNHPELAADYPAGSPAFQSFLPLLSRRRSPYLHWWYSFSKDFGISGLRIGLLYSHNEALLTGFANYGAPQVASNLPQHLLGRILSHRAERQAFTARNQTRITESYLTVIRPLRRLGIPYAPARGSLFVWLDLSRFLTAPTPAAETELWQLIYRQTGVLLTAPGGFGQP
ncbi:MAG: aminotransferase class I/II-fold pyridoxal phosphate-dependent enzyme [Saprospiraceae bacterium]